MHMTASAFCELSDTGLVRIAGADAEAFLHAQLTSDVAALAKSHTQYGGYCTAKGRLIATVLLWKFGDFMMLQLPQAIAEDVRARLSRYVLRSKATLSNETSAYALFGLFGAEAAAALQALMSTVPADVHTVAEHQGMAATRLGGERYVVMVQREHVNSARHVLSSHAREDTDEAKWTRLDIEQGIAVITTATQEEFVPQMVNLDLIGGVSYSKGCYPGQEIVARTHYLGRSKQRMHRVQSNGPEVMAPGDRLYSTVYGPEQASGTIVNAVAAGNGYQGLAVIQNAAAASGDIRLRSPQGATLAIQPLPYSIPG